jgi:hypothetical protein
MAISSDSHSAGEAVHADFEPRSTSPGMPDDPAARCPMEASAREDFGPDGRRIELAATAFVALGVLLRVGHYLANYPIWGDEAFLALNFLDRGYLDLLLPLKYAQICPILFLWAELTAVKLFGFSEMSLRLCPLLCGVGSVFLFGHVAVRVLKGPAMLLAVAIFAVSIHPIRHSADVKPYASDLLVALVLVALAIEWCRSSQKTGWLWLLVGFTPIALAASYPAILVAGGIALALAPSVWKTRRRGPMIALTAYVVIAATTFAALFVVYVHRQRGSGALPALQRYWADSFPPLDSPIRLARWLITTHTGSMFAYPWGGSHGASTATLIIVLIAGIVLVRWRQGTVLSLLVMPMGVALAAAALRLFPYGGEARIMQYIAPAICMMAGLGLSTLIGLLPSSAGRAAVVKVAAMTLAIVGVVVLMDEFRHPYRAIYDYQVREFARRFWPEQAQGVELACVQWDYGIVQRGAAVVRTALYLCNQHIYSPIRRRGGGPHWSLVARDRPLRCVVFDDVHLKCPQTTAWLESMQENYDLRGRRDLVVRTVGLDSKPWDDHVFVFEFEPRRQWPAIQSAAGGTANRTAR